MTWARLTPCPEDATNSVVKEIMTRKSHNWKKKPLLSEYDEICGTRTMALLSQFQALKNTMRVESRQLASTEEFLNSRSLAKDLDLSFNPIVYSSN